MNELKLLANETRFRIAAALAKRGMTHAELLKELDEDLVSLYPHLQQLTKGGLVVKEEVDRRNVVYHLNKEALRRVHEMMEELLECQS